MNPTLDQDMPIHVVRTNRKKTASIKIVDGSVQAIVPRTLSDAGVTELIRKHTPWIQKKLRQKSETVIPKPKEYVTGESFTYLGQHYCLKLRSGGVHEVTLKGGYLELGISKETRETDIRNALVDWYEKHALERLTDTTERYAKLMSVTPNSIVSKHYKARWGSCSSKGDISYNWRVIIAPPRIVDYVVVHELCHLQHPNHSPAYWGSVKRELPNYQEYRHWLKLHGPTLFI